MKWFLGFPATLVLTSIALASDLNLRIESGGNTSITVRPEQVIPYRVIGELSDNNHEGLAMFVFDLKVGDNEYNLAFLNQAPFGGGALPQAGTPVGDPMARFASPLGLNNPNGFGGSVRSSGLLQVGGAQNTIKNTLPSANLTGTVLTGVADFGSPQILVEGTITAPHQFGTYTLSIDPDTVMANVIRQGETGTPFWRVEPTGTGTITNLQITVESLAANISSISLTAGGSQTLSVYAGSAAAGKIYWIASNASGIAATPLITGPFGNPYVLKFDALTQFMLGHASPPQWVNNFWFLDAQGEATAFFVLGPNEIDPEFIGVVIGHEFSVFDFSINFFETSNPVFVTLVP